MRERARAAYGPSPAVRGDTPDSRKANDPCHDAEAEQVEWLGAMRDVTAIKGDIISPVSELSDWDVYRSDAISGEDDREAPLKLLLDTFAEAPGRAASGGRTQPLSTR